MGQGFGNPKKSKLDVLAESAVFYSPYPGCRLVIANTEKFQSLPQETQDKINQFFEIQEKSSEESQQINNAILQQLQTVNLD